MNKDESYLDTILESSYNYFGDDDSLEGVVHSQQPQVAFPATTSTEDAIPIQDLAWAESIKQSNGHLSNEYFHCPTSQCFNSRNPIERCGVAPNSVKLGCLGLNAKELDVAASSEFNREESILAPAFFASYRYFDESDRFKPAEPSTQEPEYGVAPTLIAPQLFEFPASCQGGMNLRMEVPDAILQGFGFEVPSDSAGNETVRKVAVPRPCISGSSTSVKSSRLRFARKEHREEYIWPNEGRKEKLLRYKLKKSKRRFGHQIKYMFRKILAENQPRIRGRFSRKLHNEM